MFNTIADSMFALCARFWRLWALAAYFRIIPDSYSTLVFHGLAFRASVLFCMIVEPSATWAGEISMRYPKLQAGRPHFRPMFER